MEDDDSWHPEYERPYRRRKKKDGATPYKKSTASRRGRRRAKPCESLETTTKDEEEASPHESEYRPRGRERACKRARTEPRGCSAGKLPPPEVGSDFEEVAQVRKVDLKPARQAPSTSRRGSKRGTKCQRSDVHSEPNDPEEVMDEMAKQYVENIEPDLSTVVETRDRDSSLPNYGRVCDDESTKRRRASSAPGRRAGSSRHKSSPDDTCIVTEVPPGRLAELLPPGTHVRRPQGKLVQLVAQVIHESPHKALRVQHVYTALQNRYPYFRFMSKKEVTTWKSSIRHALFQRWFKKVVFDKSDPAPDTRGASHGKSNFWRVDYENRPREWEMPDAPPQVEQAQEEVLSEALAELKNACKSHRESERLKLEEPRAGLEGPSTATQSVWPRKADVKFDMMSPHSLPSPQKPKAYKVLLSPETAMQPLKCEQQIREQQASRQQPQNQYLNQHQQLEKREEQGACDPTPILSPPPPASTPKSWGTDSVKLRLSPPGWCTGIEDISSDLLFGAQASEGRPSSRQSSCSQSMLLSILGSPATPPSHMEEDQPHGHQNANREHAAASLSPSIYLRTKQEPNQWVENAVSNDSNFLEHRNIFNLDERSRGSDLDLFKDHVYARRVPEAGAHIGVRGPLASSSFLLSPRTSLNNLAPYVGGDFHFPSPQQWPHYASAHEVRSPHYSFMSPERLPQESGAMMLPPPFSPRQSREETLSNGEPAQPPLEALLAQARPVPPIASARPEFVMRGSWMAGPPAGPSRRCIPYKLPTKPFVGEPVYSAIPDTVELVRARDGTLYILAWPTDVDAQSCVEHAKCEVE